MLHGVYIKLTTQKIQIVDSVNKLIKQNIIVTHNEIPIGWKALLWEPDNIVLNDR